MFEGSARRTISVDGMRIDVVHGGQGPPVLLLHGYPQTHGMWHRVAPTLAEQFTVVCADPRGYGDSGKPLGDAIHEAYSKRTTSLGWRCSASSRPRRPMRGSARRAPSCRRDDRPRA
jgi:haloacetate dehalogenase